MWTWTKIREYYEDMIQSPLPPSRSWMADEGRLMLALLPHIEAFCEQHNLSAFLSVGTLCVSPDDAGLVVCIHAETEGTFKVILEENGTVKNETYACMDSVTDVVSSYLSIALSK